MFSKQKFVGIFFLSIDPRTNFELFCCSVILLININVLALSIILLSFTVLYLICIIKGFTDKVHEKYTFLLFYICTLSFYEKQKGH